MESTHPVLFFLGATHHTAPLAIREKLALDDARLATLAARLQAAPNMREFAFLNTCNRVELYGVGSAQVCTDFIRALAEVTGLSEQEVGSVVRTHFGHHAIEHLFSVAAGLDSQIVGETEILGQVKASYDAALAKRWTGPILNRVFQKTFQAAKHIRTNTGIGAGQVSVASVSVDLAGKIFGELAPVNLLVIGAGDIGVKTVQAFQSRGTKKITVASRTLSRAEEAAAAAGGWAASMADLPEVLAAADIVASSTSSPDLILTHDLVAQAMKRRPARPLFLIDLALPRDIDPRTTELSNVYLYNLDDLAEIAEENIAQREAEVARCRAIIAERTANLWPAVAHHLTPPS